MNDVTEEEISRNYENLLKTKLTSDKRLLNQMMIKSNRIDRERRDFRSRNLIHNRNSRNKNSFLYELAFNQKNLMPGLYFSHDIQCKLIFGANSRICPYMSPCKRLWCTPSNSNLNFEKDTGCKTQHIPWSEGTSCSDYLINNQTINHLTNVEQEHWCIKGECVSKQAYLKSSLIVNGQWSEWGDWSECSRTCEGGISSRGNSILLFKR